MGKRGEPDAEKEEAEVEKIGAFLRTKARQFSSDSLAHLADKAFELAAQEPEDDGASDDEDPLAEVRAPAPRASWIARKGGSRSGADEERASRLRTTQIGQVRWHMVETCESPNAPSAQSVLGLA